MASAALCSFFGFSFLAVLAVVETMFAAEADGVGIDVGEKASVTVE